MAKARGTTFSVRRWWGKQETSWPIERLGEIVDELAQADAEHGDVDLTHESEWAISYHRNKTAIFENVEEGEPRHMLQVSRAKLLAMWQHLATGDLAWLEKQPWKKGYGKRAGT